MDRRRVVPSPVPEAVASLSSFGFPSSEWAAEQADRMRRGVAFGSYRELGGVGERAFLLDRHTAGAVLCVFQNPYYLQISVFGAGDGPQKPAVLETLARAALRRLTLATAKSGFTAVRGPG